MRHLSCPHCGSTELHCRNEAASNLLGLLPAWLLGKGLATGVSVSALAAVLLNLFMLDAGNIEPPMFWTQVGVVLLLTILAWTGAWYGERRRRQALFCQCRLCGERWRQPLQEDKGR